jgi:SET domain-containing protein
MIYVAPSELHGQGVFAARNIEAGEIIEICPILLFPRAELDAIRKTMLDDYYFDWGDEGDWYAVCLGYGSLYNHSYTPNAEYGMDFEANTIDFYCIKNIEAGAEILINYNGESDNQTKVWFEDPEHPVHKTRPQ